MEAITARASLVPAADVGEGLTTSLSRSEIEDVLASEEAPIELVLDVTRFSDGEAAETHNVAVSWERSDLERLLQEAQGDEVVLTFDREALSQAIESDVEGHGIRETVLALAVAATAATGVAANASADPGQLPGLRGTVATQSTGSPDDRAVSMAAPAPEATVGVDDRAVSRATPSPDPVLGVDDRAVPRSAPVQTPSMAPDDRAVPRSAPADTPSLAPDDRAVPRTAPVQTPSMAPDDRAVPRATPAPTSAPTSVSPDDRAVPRSTPVAAPVTGTSTDTGISWAPSPAETAALAGVIALAITGAFFMVGGRRRMRPGAA
ncbi:MAG TPA: hypothetical protein VKO41_03740 [Gaiellaceae bacterium]|nr:hypothetical protein [Gaiellaceae bacterium]